MAKFIHDVSGYKMEIELIETETPPNIITDDPKMYSLISKKWKFFI